MKQKPWLWLGGGLALLVVVPVAWYLASPLFITRAVDEPLPTAMVVVVAASATPVSPAAPATSVTPVPSAIAAASATPAATPVPEISATAGPQLLAAGAFYDIVHEGEGQASVIQLTDGVRVLRFESFMVLNGPDLFVYLVPENPVPNVVGSDLPVFINLGALKGNVGDQNYELPADLDLSQYHSVVIWCRAFKVPFAAAPLAAPES